MFESGVCTPGAISLFIREISFVHRASQLPYCFAFLHRKRLYHCNMLIKYVAASRLYLFPCIYFMYSPVFFISLDLEWIWAVTYFLQHLCYMMQHFCYRTKSVTSCKNKSAGIRSANDKQATQIAWLVWLTWGPPGSWWSQVGPVLAPRIFLSTRLAVSTKATKWHAHLVGVSLWLTVQWGQKGEASFLP